MRGICRGCGTSDDSSPTSPRRPTRWIYATTLRISGAAAGGRLPGRRRRCRPDRAVCRRTWHRSHSARAGTSLAGQVVGGGIVVDLGRHLNRILSLDVERRRVRVQPGAVRNDLNRFLCAVWALLRAGKPPPPIGRRSAGRWATTRCCAEFDRLGIDPRSPPLRPAADLLPMVRRRRSARSRPGPSRKKTGRGPRHARGPHLSGSPRHPRRRIPPPRLVRRAVSTARGHAAEHRLHRACNAAARCLVLRSRERHALQARAGSWPGRKARCSWARTSSLA